MANVGIDGLASGLDTTSLIAQLMKVESASQTALKTRVTSTTGVVTALQGLNSRVASLAGTAKDLARAEAFTAMKATSSGPAATATAGSTAAAGSLSFAVTSLAAAHSVLTDVVPADPGDGSAPTLTLTTGGTTRTITLTSWDPQAIATAINDADPDPGVSAAAVRVADGSYRLKVTADGTGAAKAFTLGGSLAPADPANAIITTGTDAEISLGAGATVRSATNTFTGLLLGVDVTVAAKTAADAPPVTVTIAKDTSAATTKVAALVSSLGVVLSDIADRTKAASDGTSGVLVGDSGMRLLRAALSDAVSGLAGGAPLSQIGVELKRDGTVVFDQGKLAAMLASDPAKAKAMVTDLATRLADVAKGASDPTTGTITQAITSQKDTVKDLNDRITTWDTRLAVRKSALERQFASLETALQGMNSQSSWLGSAIAGLPGFR